MASDTRLPADEKETKSAPALVSLPPQPIIPLTKEQCASLIDDLRSADMHVRTNSLRKLQSVARFLGPDRTREELVPYLNEFTDDDDDVLLVLAEELGQLIEAVGGANHAHVLLQPLEALAAVEESVVREKAVNSISMVSNALSVDSLARYVLPLIKKLSSGDWFTSRISAASLFHVVYPRANPALRKDIRAMYIKLCTDDTPMVRRAVCANTGKLASVVEFAFVKTEMWGPFSLVAKDDQDSVRLLTVASCIDVAKVFQSQGPEMIGKMLVLVFQLVQDKSWRVRYMVADKFCDLWKGMGEREVEGKADELVDGFVSLLQDPEAEVRTVAASRVGDVAKLVGPVRTLRKLLPPIKLLVKDSSQYARAELGSVIMSIAHVVKKKDVFDHLLPLYLQLLKDSHSEVRLNIISKLDMLNQVIGVDVLSQSLLPAIVELANDKKWRVRLSIIQHIPLLAKQLGTEFFESKLSDLCMSWLGDPVYSIREAATANLNKLSEGFGTGWAQRHIVPKVEGNAAHKSYLFRMTALYAIKDLARTLGTDVTTRSLLPIVVKLATDPVANIRFNVAKTMANMMIYVRAAEINNIAIPCLRRLALETDAEVRYYANNALSVAATVLAGGTPESPGLEPSKTEAPASTT